MHEGIVVIAALAVMTASRPACAASTVVACLVDGRIQSGVFERRHVAFSGDIREEQCVVQLAAAIPEQLSRLHPGQEVDMDANFYLLLFFCAMFVLSMIGLGLTLLLPEDDTPNQLPVVRRHERTTPAMGNVPSCRYRGQTGRRDHFSDGAGVQRSRLNKI